MITELCKEYVFSDDTILYSNKKDGVVFKVLTDDLMSRRYLEFGDFKVGDAVATKFQGKIILGTDNTVSHENVVELSRLSAEEIQKFNRKIDKNPYPFIQYTKTRNAIQTGRFESIHDDESGMPAPSVKDMPEYDPDAEITGLTLTIPSWCSSIKRTMRNADFTKLSPLAKEKLLLALFELEDKIENLIDIIKEDEYHG